MYSRNEFLYGNQVGFHPRPVALHGPQTVNTNAPYSREARLLVELSRATPPRWSPIQLAVGPNPIGVGTTGNTVYVDLGFVSSFSDQELLGALAHELAHGDLGHIGMVQAAGLLVTGIFRAVTKGHHIRDGTVLAHDLTQGFVTGQFSQTQELEADRQGKAYLDALGYDGTAIMISLMGKLQAMGGGQWPNWFASHPAISERMASLRDLHVASTAAFSGGNSLQRGLGLIPPSHQTSQPSPPVVAKAEGEVVSMHEVDGGAIAIEIKKGDNSIVPVIVGPGSVVHLDEKNVTLQPYKVKPGMLVSAEYVFDADRNRSFASSLRLASHEQATSPGVSPADKQRTLGAQIAGLYSSARRKLGFSEKPGQEEVNSRTEKESTKSISSQERKSNASGGGGIGGAGSAGAYTFDPVAGALNIPDASSVFGSGGLVGSAGYTPSAVSSTRVQCPAGKEFYDADVKTCPIHKAELRGWRQK